MDRYYNSPGPNRQLVLIQRNGIKWYKEMEPKKETTASTTTTTTTNALPPAYLTGQPAAPETPSFPVPFTLHINITLNSSPLHQATHHKLDARNYHTLGSLLAHVESLYLAYFNDAASNTLDLSLTTGIPRLVSDESRKHPCRGILFLSEKNHVAPDSYMSTSIALAEIASNNEGRYQNWFWRNMTKAEEDNGRRGWVGFGQWAGHELEVSLSLHLKEQVGA